MTWSIIAREPATGQIGIAAASRFFAVGVRLPFIASGVGAIATQALVNSLYGTNGLRLLRGGHSAAEVVSMLIAADAGRDHRQLHVMDSAGRVAAYTGAACVDWCGHLTGEGWSVAGNFLAGAAVLEDTVEAFLENSKLPMAPRLVAAMQAGEAAGGDKRGKQSAVLKIYGEEEWPDLDLRVDDHTDPLVELERLEAVSRERFVYFTRLLPRRADPVGLIDRDAIEAKIAAARTTETSE
ncbi:MAG: DUF1028 domain-containing protein [Bradyrhizobiaceae bacterium]|nr:DUF1028 domain-containing protein [Bradyrhizobiaceae bacterium]